MSDVRIHQFYPQNSPSLPFDHATPPAPFRFAFQKRPLAYIFLSVKRVFWLENSGLRPVGKHVPELGVFCNQTGKVNTSGNESPTKKWILKNASLCWCFGKNPDLQTGIPLLVIMLPPHSKKGVAVRPLF
jgi:hypothetical protein